MKDRLWVKLRFLRGAGPRGPPRGRGGVTCRRCASGEGSASCAAGSGAATPPRRPAPAPQGPAARPRGSVPPLSPEALARPPPAPRTPRALRAVGAVHGERIMAIEGKWRPSKAWRSPPGGRAQGLGGRPRRRLWVRAVRKAVDAGHRPRRGVRSWRALAYAMEALRC